MATVVFGGLIAQVLPQPAGVAKLAAAAPLLGHGHVHATDETGDELGVGVPRLYLKTRAIALGLAAAVGRLIALGLRRCDRLGRALGAGALKYRRLRALPKQ